MADIQTLGDEGIYVKFPGAAGYPSPSSGGIFAQDTFPSEGYRELRTIKDKLTGKVIWAHKWRLSCLGLNGTVSMTSTDNKFTRTGNTGRCKDGKTITVSVTPNPGYKFKQWKYDTPKYSTITESESGNELVVEMKEHLDISAKIDPILIVESGGYTRHSPTRNSVRLIGNLYSSDAVNTFSKDGYAEYTINGTTYIGLYASDVGYSGGIFVKAVRGKPSSTSTTGPEHSINIVTPIPVPYSEDGGATWNESETTFCKQHSVCGGMWNGRPRYVIVCDPTTTGSVAGKYVGAWYSSDCKSWTRSTLGDDPSDQLDDMTHCGYCKLNGNDVFVYTSTCNGGKCYVSLDGGVNFTKRLNYGGNAYDPGLLGFGGSFNDGNQLVVIRTTYKPNMPSHLYLEISTDGSTFTERELDSNAGVDLSGLRSHISRGTPRMAACNGFTILSVGGLMWRTEDTDMNTATWSKISETFRDQYITDLISTGNMFIAVTAGEPLENSDTTPGKIWTSTDGSTWVVRHEADKLAPSGIAASSGPM